MLHGSCECAGTKTIWPEIGAKCMVRRYSIRVTALMSLTPSEETRRTIYRHNHRQPRIGIREAIRETGSPPDIQSSTLPGSLSPNRRRSGKDQVFETAPFFN